MPEKKRQQLYTGCSAYKYNTKFHQSMLVTETKQLKMCNYFKTLHSGC